jgi:hypothetical protein
MQKIQEERGRKIKYMLDKQVVRLEDDENWLRIGVQ